jgi:hypothetical protein
MHYTLPLSINDRREIYAELTTIAKPNNTNYLIVFPDTNAVTLLRINKQQLLKSFIERNCDIPLTNIAYTATFNNGVLQVNLSASSTAASTQETSTAQNTAKDSYYHELDEKALLTQKQAQQRAAQQQAIEVSTSKIADVNQEFTLSLSENANYLIVSAAAWEIEGRSNFSFDNLALQIIYTAADASYTYSTTLCMAHPSTFLGLALDFGSESSQMATLRYDTEHGVALRRPQVVNLFEHVMNYHVNHYGAERRTGVKYYQEEPDDNFYRSIFFMKEALSGDYEDLENEPLIKDQKDNLQMLVDTGSSAALMEDRHYQLPNLKISHKHADVLKRYKFQMKLNGYSYTSNLDELQGMVTNNILRTFVASILQSDRVRFSKVQRNVRLMLLVPNIYDMRQVNKVQRSLNQILSDLATNEFAGRIKHWEVLTISESDAAFIGYMSKPESVVQQNSDYVIVDVGKGTTDFSILRTGASNSFDLQPIYRNGFAGAGNLITHAMFETVVHFIREHSAGANTLSFIREKIIAMLDSNDLAFKNSFFEQIERLKFDFRADNTEQIKAQWLSVRTGDFNWGNIAEKDASGDIIISLLRQLSHGADFYGYINDVCEAISEKIVSHLELVAQHKTNFNCAGVMLTGRGFLFQPLAQLVRSKIGRVITIDAARIDMLVGNELKDVCIKGVFDSSIKINAEAVGHPIQIIKAGAAQVQANVSVSGVQQKAGNWIDRWFFRSIENEMKAAKKLVIQDSQLQTSTLANSTMAIGCTMYKVGSQRLLADLQEGVHSVSIDFTNDGYKVRRMLGSTVDCVVPLVLVEDYTSSDQRMVIPSLFPNYMQEAHVQSMRADVQRAAIMPATGIVMDNPFSPNPNNDLYF